MVITYLKLKNWRNFKEIEINLRGVSYLIGPNASGKSNLLDVFRFLRDVCKADGGGLQKAIKARGGIKKLRCLHHRRDNEVLIEVHLSDSFDSVSPLWRYILGFKPEGKGLQRVLVSREEVWKEQECLLSRPQDSETADPLQLTETYLEQTLANQNFRPISEELSGTTYLHLVPQLLKFGDLIGGNRLEDDPFGQGFLEKLAKAQPRTRDARLRRIEKALTIAVPRFKELKFKQDELGHPHLEALYEHHRPGAGWQSEEQFSDGTLRLIALLWSLQEGDGLLLLEEPELSLHEGVVEQIPALIDRVQRSGRTRRQILISTHSEPLLRNQGIDAAGVLILEPGAEGTRIRTINESETVGLMAGLSVADAVLPQTRPSHIRQLGLWQ